jgi:hypothetical protein
MATKSATPPRVVRIIDQIGEEEEDPTPKSYTGALFSFCALTALVVYAILAIHTFQRSPFPLDITAKWTSVDGPVQPGPLYPMSVKCLAADGCQVGIFYSSRTPFSTACATNTAQVFGSSASGARIAMAAENVLTFHVCYSDDPTDGLFAWYNGTSPFGIAVESVAPINGVVTAVMVPVHEGRTLMKLVNTTNHTYAFGAFGYARAEWYPTLLSPQPLAIAPDAMHSAQAFIDAQWTEVLVYDRDAWDLLSTIGGAWTVMIGIAAICHVFFLSLAQKLAGAAIEGARKSLSGGNVRGSSTAPLPQRARL